MRFRYSTSDPAQDEFDSLPRIPVTLRYHQQSMDVIGLVDSGATVSVLPYEFGLQLGAQWDDRKANLRLAGNLGKSPAMPLFVMATIGDFAPVRLAFAWVKVANAPLILGQTNFLWNLMSTFTARGWNSRLNPKRKKPLRETTGSS